MGRFQAAPTHSKIMLSLVAAVAMASAPTPATIYEFTLPDIDGKDVALSQYKGKTLLIVNVASKCGLTPQYESLEKLYKSYKSQGLVVLGFPANDFGEQEPGSNTEIKQFCSASYGVSFPMFSKIKVTGEPHPLYKYLLQNGPRKDAIEWNFAKFLVNSQGKIVARFKPQQRVDQDEVLNVIKQVIRTR